MIALIVILLVLWVALGAVGFLVKGLVWLGIIAVVLFVITGIAGWIKGRVRS